MSFEWQTEDERSWEQPDAAADNQDNRPGRRWPWLLLVVVLLAGGAYVTWRQVQERVDEATEVVRDEVRTSYSLSHRAASQQDEELFVTLLSGRSATWTDSQKERLARGLLFEKTARVLDFEPQDEASTPPEVELNPELSEAVLTARSRFVVDAGAGLTETVVLTQTHVFREGSQRWLLSPPTDEFWGGAWRTRTGEALQLAYRPRDEDLARRLGDDLERKLLEMCRTLMSCPDDFSMSLRLESDPQSVLFAADGEQRLSGDRELILPTPTLVGLPADEAAYAALFRGYARQLLSAAMMRVLQYSCCETVIYQEALLDWQLSRLNLRSVPIQTEDYLYLVDAPTSIDHMVALSRPRTPLGPGEEAPPEVHAFIDFMQSNLSMRRDPLLELQRSLTQNGSFWTWVIFSTDYQPGNPSALWSDWSDFMFEKAREAQELAEPPPPDDAPQQDIVALCNDGNGIDLYRYSLLTGEWSRELEVGFENAVVAAVPDGNGYLVSGQFAEQGDVLELTSYLQRGEESPIIISQEGESALMLLPWQVGDPGNARMVVWEYSQSGNDEFFTPEVSLLDPESCTPEGCTLEQLPGMPIWSPAGRLALVFDMFDNRLLYLPEERTQWQEIEANLAARPYWLNEETFIYVEQQGGALRHTVSLFNTEDGESRQLVSTDELSALYERRSQNSRPLQLTWAGPHPSRENTILVLGIGNDTTGYLFNLSLQPDQSLASATEPQVSVLETFRVAGPSDPWFGFGTNYLQNERFLMIPSQRGGQWGTTIYDLQTERVVLESSIANEDDFNGAGTWSLDGNSFARALPRALDLLRPSLQNDGRPYRQLIFHDFEYCRSPVWVNRQ
ncbi:MAG: hypothetical protein ACOC9Z_01990 [Chloroflexota bacterium]